jgi:hypothetical protein
VVDLPGAHRNYGAHTRLLRGVIVHANLAKGGHAHLVFKCSDPLRRAQRFILEHVREL